MLCQHCGKNPATTHIKRIYNGELTEYALCSHCARSLGYADIFGGLGIHLENLLGSQAREYPREEELRCKGCGSTFDEIARTGTVGCAQCYHTFYQQLAPMLQKLHGNTVHRGKSPIKAELTVRPQTGIQVVPDQNDLLEAKKKLLQQAIVQENFELAAVLRDEIKAIKGAEKHE